MSLSSTSIKRPVLATVFSLVILIFGLIGMTYLGVREFPSVDPAIISVNTSYPGANSDVIETQITEPLEQSINGIPGVRTLTSVSRQGGSNITVEFELSVDMETAANDVRDKVSQAQRFLPRDVDPPIVAKADADANGRETPRLPLRDHVDDVDRRGCGYGRVPCLYEGGDGRGVL